MMRKDQILAAGMDIDLLPQILLCHHGTLNMPARTPLAPLGIPVGLAFLFGLPQHEIRRALLPLLTSHLNLPETGLQFIQILVGQLAVIPERIGPEIHRPVKSRIGIPFINQGLYHLKHTGNLLRCLRMCGGRLHIHTFHILFALFDITAGDHLRLHALLNRLLDDLIVHIGKIGHIIDLIAFIFKISPHRIKHDHRPGIPDMDVIVNSRAAYIHLHLSRLQRHKFLFPSAQCVENFHCCSPFSLLPLPFRHSSCPTIRTCTSL